MIKKFYSVNTTDAKLTQNQYSYINGSAAKLFSVCARQNNRGTTHFLQISSVATIETNESHRTLLSTYSYFRFLTQKMPQISTLTLHFPHTLCVYNKFHTKYDVAVFNNVVEVGRRVKERAPHNMTSISSKDLILLNRHRNVTFLLEQNNLFFSIT